MTTLNPLDKHATIALSNGDLTATKVNQAPTDIALANLVDVGLTVPEDTPVSTSIFTISGTDPDGDALTFSEVADPDGKFTVSGTTVTLAAALDYETSASHSLTIRATDVHGATYDEAFTILVGDVTEWTPVDLGVTIWAWYDASDSGSITQSGGSVSQINDLSGNNRHLFQGTVLNQPSSTASTLGGLPTLYFDGSNDFLAGSGMGTQAQAYAVTVLFQPEATGSTYPILMFGGSMRMWSKYSGAAHIGAATQTSTGLTLTNDVPYLWSVVFNGASTTNAFNGGARSTIAIGTGSLSNLTICSAGADTHYKGDVAEILITVGILSLSDQQKLEGYLAHKWDVTSILPGGHPYKTIPPTA